MIAAAAKITQTRGVELARAVQAAEAQGPVYLHCHHGKHRAPTAAAVVCRALDGWTADEAIDRSVPQPQISPLESRDLAPFGCQVIVRMGLRIEA